MKGAVLVPAKVPALAPQPEIVELLEELLADAKKGEIVGIAGVCKRADGDVRPHRDFDNNHKLEIIGALQVLNTDMAYHVLCSHEIDG